VSLISRPLTKNMKVVDTGEKLSRAQARALRAAGIDAVFRYVFYGEPRAEDLDNKELIDCTSEDLIVCVVQHPRLPENNILSVETGKSDAQWAMTNALAAGYDPAVVAGPPLSLSSDMEGVRNPGPNSAAHGMTWVNLVALGVGGNPFGPVTYLGYLCGLSGGDCDAMLPEVAFWCDAGPYDLRPKISRGYALKQEDAGVIAGVKIDYNTVLKDNAIFGAAAA
jgi:hypothetical protein